MPHIKPLLLLLIQLKDISMLLQNFSDLFLDNQKVDSSLRKEALGKQIRLLGLLTRIGALLQGLQLEVLLHILRQDYPFDLHISN